MVNDVKRSSDESPIARATSVRASTRRPLRKRVLRIAGVLVGVLIVLLVVNVRTDLSLAELTPKYGGGASKFVSIEGVDLHYRDEGQGPPLVLVHGSSS